MNDLETGPSIQALLQENLALAKETHEIVRKIHRDNRIALWFKIVFWTIVIVLPFFLIKPILSRVFPAGNNGFPNFQSLGGPTSAEIQRAIEIYRSGGVQQNSQSPQGG